MLNESDAGEILELNAGFLFESQRGAGGMASDNSQRFSHPPIYRKV